MNIEKTLNIDTKRKIQVGEEQMTIYAAARWSALLGGIEIITKHAARNGIDMNDDKTWLKPLALQKFIKEETPVACAEIHQCTTSSVH